jgi:serine/threonine protein kinase
MENKSPVSVTESKDLPSLLPSGCVLQSRYRIVRKLGSGGMGAVYEAVDERLDTTVALKETFSIDSRLRRQFEQEARLLARLHHPALPRVSDYFTEGDRAFLVMQFIAGADLAEIIATQPGPFPRNQVIAWADQLLDALVYLHTRDRQIIHRDIKPHNLKLTSTGRIALLDFGLAKTESADLSAANSSTSIFGYTRRYSPLEQIQDQGTSPRSDIYALGATLYHLLTGVKPPDALARAAAMAKSKSELLKPAHEVHPAVGSEIAAILSRAMALDPEGRFQSAGDFREALRRVGRDENGEKETAIASGSGSANSIVNATVVRRPSVAVVDPFDSYSILKPDDALRLISKPTRFPALLVAILLILLGGGFVTFYGLDHWTENTGAVLDYGRANPEKDSSGTNSARANTSESARPRSASAKNSSIASGGGEVTRKHSTQKRHTSQTDAARARTPALTPPAVSILP